MAEYVSGKVFLITGGASGLGYSIAEAVLSRGGIAALADIDMTALKNAESVLDGHYPGKVSTHTLDVTDESAWIDCLSEVLSAHNRLDVLVNNAGVGIAPEGILDIDTEIFRRVMDINTFGTLYGIRCCLESILRTGEGGVINVASTSGLVGLSGYSAYSMSKAAVRNLGESLQMEYSNTGLGVLNVFSGGIKTNLMRNAQNLNQDEAEKVHKGFQKFAILTPQRAAGRILRAYSRRRRKIVLGFDSCFILFFSRVMGRPGLRLLRYFFGISFAADE